MRYMRDIAMMMLGAGALFTYQKYNEQLKHTLDKTMQMIDERMEDMM